MRRRMNGFLRLYNLPTHANVTGEQLSMPFLPRAVPSEYYSYELIVLAQPKSECAPLLPLLNTLSFIHESIK